MPVAEMISGTIIGEIKIAMITRLAGTWLWLRPMAASVPNDTDKMVAIGAIKSEFQKDRNHSPFESDRSPKKSA